MAAELLFAKNSPHEGPGQLETVARNRGIDFEVVELTNEPFPDAAGYKAVVVLGGPDSANDATPKMRGELERVKQMLQTDTAYLGICLGMQALVKAAGGNVTKALVKEVGFLDDNGSQFTVGVTQAGQRSSLLAGLPANLNVFHLHGETVEPTGTMRLLATGKYCTNQIVQVTPRAYGIQSHFELTSEMLSVWAHEDPDLEPIGERVLLSQFGDIEGVYRAIGETLFNNFLDIADL